MLKTVVKSGASRPSGQLPWQLPNKEGTTDTLSMLSHDFDECYNTQVIACRHHTGFGKKFLYNTVLTSLWSYFLLIYIELSNHHRHIFDSFF